MLARSRRTAAPRRRSGPVGRAPFGLRVPPGGWSRNSDLSLLSVSSQLSVLSVGSLLSLASAGSILSVGSSGSVLSVGSAGSILSIGSAGSVLSVGSFLSIRGVGTACRLPGVRDRRDDGADVEPLPPARLVGTALGALALAGAVLDA